MEKEEEEKGGKRRKEKGTKGAAACKGGGWTEVGSGFRGTQQQCAPSLFAEGRKGDRKLHPRSAFSGSNAGKKKRWVGQSTVEKKEKNTGTGRERRLGEGRGGGAVEGGLEGVRTCEILAGDEPMTDEMARHREAAVERWRGAIARRKRDEKHR